MAQIPKLLVGGIYFGEAPRWREDRLWFSDFYAHAVKSVSVAGDLRTEIELDDQPSGLGWMPDGSMLIVSMTKRQVLRRTADGTIRLHADLSHLAGFHCNDMVVDAEGRAYVGNFGFDLDAEMSSRGVEAVLADHAVARLIRVDPDGAVQTAAEDMHFPNGSVITPDGKTLIVGETLSGALTAFDIEGDGSLSNRRVWASLGSRVPDGICLDAEGAIWIANPLAPECVRFAEGGEVLEVIETERPCYACALGGEDRRTLFMMTAETSMAHELRKAPKGRVLTASVETPGAVCPSQSRFIFARRPR